ncbi:MAG: phosphoenolpyruvate synthase, partial [Xanthomonadales bacterium]|nr:phosphoenolpyruvate synthase [Xanthomonadales bacterium]
MSQYIAWLHELGMQDLGQVGGKNASLGEMISQLADLGVEVPGGFATTAFAFAEFLQQSGLKERIDSRLASLDVDDVTTLAATGAEIRSWIMNTPFPAALQDAIEQAWQQLVEQSGKEPSVAVRSSATAEDLPDASFAGQQETFLNVTGLSEVLAKIHEVFASLYNDRAIAYRVHQGFDHSEVYLSAGVQLMVRSDLASSGVMFTLDTESGFRDAVFVTSAWGLGETVVQGAVNPDEFYVFKPALRAGREAILRRNLGSKAMEMVFREDGTGVATLDVDASRQQRFSLSDEEVEALARHALVIEEHYGRPMDIEWAKDGENGRLYIVQARPETVRSQQQGGQKLERFQLMSSGELLCEGRSIGQKIGAGPARVVSSIEEMHAVQPGDVLVTDMTDPDWEPVMKRAAAIVTNRGGRTCHAAIIARELGIPAVVGCRNATEAVSNGQAVTVSCSEGDTGYVYAGELEFAVREDDLAAMPEAPLKIMMNVANPDRAFDFSMIPNEGVGLARLEFIINRMIGIHPKVLLNYDQQDDSVKQITDP